MPAIDPDRLNREIGSVVEAFDQPSILRQRLVDLLQFYADRTRRPGRPGEDWRAPWTIGAPRPVVNQLRRELTGRAVAQQEPAWAAAESLWQAGFRETQMLAAAILGVIESETIVDWAEERAGSCVDAASLGELAGKGLDLWRKAHPQDFLQRVATWLRAEGRSRAAFGLAALTSAAQDPSFEDLPSIFRLVGGMSQMAGGEARGFLISLIRTLARRSPPETARFLLEERYRGGDSAQWLLKQSLDAFPLRQQDPLRRALSR